jgi:predicted O-methyltransferase YrrM
MKATRAKKLTRRAAKRLRRAKRRLPKQLRAVRRSAYRLYNVRRRRSYASSLAKVPARDELPAVLRSRGLLGKAVEVGVKRGKFSEFLLSRWPGERLISIDPWLEDGADAYIDHANVVQDEHEQFYRETIARLERFGSRSEIWRETSRKAASRVKDGSLDFAYIDARHDYDSVLDDLEAWFPKVKAGGIIAGHDYVNGSFPSGEFGVKRAVDEFFGARGLPVHSTRAPSPVEMFPTWLVEVLTSGK